MVTIFRKCQDKVRTHVRFTVIALY